MKKLTSLIFVMLMIIGCTSDDNSKISEPITPEPSSNTLKLSSDIKNTSVGTETTFYITNDKKRSVEAQLFIGETEITSPYVFNEVGSFNVVAKKEGYTDSNILEINVSEEKFEQLNLVVDLQSIEVKQTATFQVRVGKQLLRDNVTIINTETNEPLKNNEFTGTETGKYTFKAVVDGYLPSEEIVITVTPRVLRDLFTFNGEEYPIAAVYIEAEVMEIEDSTGKKKLVDKPYLLDDGSFGNIYEMQFISRANNSYNSYSITFYIKNPSIKGTSASNITDYGTRILFDKTNELIPRRIFGMLSNNQTISESNILDKMGPLTFVKNEIDIKNYGHNGIDKHTQGFLNIEGTFEGAKGTFFFVYNGPFLFTEKTRL